MYIRHSRYRTNLEQASSDRGQVWYYQPQPEHPGQQLRLFPQSHVRTLKCPQSPSANATPRRVPVLTSTEGDWTSPLALFESQQGDEQEGCDSLC